MHLRLDDQVRRRLTLVLAAVIIAAGWATLLLGRFDSGVRLSWTGDRVVVIDVLPGSIAAQYGLQAGMVVTQLQDVTLIDMPHYVDPDPAMPTPDPDTGETPDYRPTIEPAAPTPIELDPAVARPASCRARRRSSSARPALGPRATRPVEEPIGVVSLYDDGLDGIRMTMPSFALGAASCSVLVGVVAGERPRRRSVAAARRHPLAIATAVPFLVRPIAGDLVAAAGDAGRRCSSSPR